MSTFAYDRLAEAGYEKVLIEYAGSGDEGWINDITPHPGEALAELPSDLHSVLERQAYDVLEREYGGWEINEGSSGTITVLVKERRATISHGWIVETTQHEDKEIS